MKNKKPTNHAFRLLAVIGLSPFAPSPATAESGSQPSQESAYIRDLRQHANERIEDRDRLRAETADEGRRLPGQQVDSEVRDSARAAAYEEARKGTSPSANTSYDQLYQSRLSSRKSGYSLSNFDSPGGGRYGSSNTGYSYSQPQRTSYFPQPTRREDSNFNLGPIDVRFGASTFAEYNDNIRRSSTNKLEDVIVGTQFDLGGSWQLTEGNRIDLNLGVGIERYLSHQDQISSSHDEFNLTVSPNSSLSFDFFLGDILINIHDRLSVRNRTRDDFTLDSFELFSEWNNAVGVSAYIPVNREVDLAFGYDYTTTRSLDNSTTFRDRDGHKVYATTSYSPDQFWTIGLETSANYSSYVVPVKNDVDSYNIGVFFETPLTEFTNIRLDGGYQILDYADTGAVASVGNHDDYYGGVAIDNELNEYFTHSVSLGHETNSGDLSDYSVVDYARYTFNLDTKRDQRIGGNVFYEKEAESGGIFQEDTTRLGFGLNYDILLTKDLGFGVGGEYSKIDSGLSSRDYERWSASLEARYALSKEFTLGLRYAHSNASSDTALQKYQQNRVTLNLNYQF